MMLRYCHRQQFRHHNNKLLSSDDLTDSAMVLANPCMYSKPTNTTVLARKSHLPELFPSGMNHWQKIREKCLKNIVSNFPASGNQFSNYVNWHLLTQQSDSCFVSQISLKDCSKISCFYTLGNSAKLMRLREKLFVLPTSDNCQIHFPSWHPESVITVWLEGDWVSGV